MKLKIGVEVWYRGETVTITGIEYVYATHKHTKIMEEIPWELKDKCIFTLSNGKTTLGLHIKTVEPVLN